MQGVLHFGDEDPAAARAPLTVSQLNREARDWLQKRFRDVWVQGEISNFTRQPSGHCYFSLKDAAAQVACVMFRGAGPAASLRNGMAVELFGEVGLYEARGQYQIVVRRVQPRGAGALEARLRALQEKLRAEGLFGQDRKRRLPPHPARVGVVTSPTGAVIRDFVQILRRRAPHIEIFIAPVRVQGAGAAAEIAAAVRSFSDPQASGFPAVDVVVVTRGGGSLEDLWEFNEEDVARAIAACSVPVVSAVGHETDVTTSDLAADLRAPTPSAAAELLSADREETIRRLDSLRRRLDRELSNRLQIARTRWHGLANSSTFQRPLRRIADERQWTDDLAARAAAVTQHRLGVLRERSARAASVIRAHSPTNRLAALRERLLQVSRRQDTAMASAMQKRREHRESALHALEILGPRQTLQRGFTITMDGERRPVTSAASAARQPVLVTLFADGEVSSKPGE